MSSTTTHFGLVKPAKTDSAAIGQLDNNMDVIDTEMYKPPLTVNSTSPDSNRNILINTVPLADNLTSDEAQINDGTYIIRTSGGEASIDNGTAFLTSIGGNMVKTGYAPEVCEMTVTNQPRPDPDDPEITAEIDLDTFRTEISNTSGTYVFLYSTAWTLNSTEVDISDYGITVTGTPIAADAISIAFTAENRGTITVAEPTSFVSTGWNLYNHSNGGKIRVCRYSETYGYKIAGTYTLLQFATTESGEKTQITPVSGAFNVPSDGWLFVSGGNATDTMVWATWSDWTEQANGGVFEAYSASTIDISGVMVNFPYGLMKVGLVADEINLNTGIAYSRIQRLSYLDNIASVIASGRAYDTDTNYVYVVRETPLTYDASAVSGSYTVNDHGMEYYTGTTVAVVSQSLYGQDLKNKLRRDVLTISPQTLTEQQQEQVLSYLGVDNAIETAKNEVIDIFDGSIKIVSYSYKYTPANAGASTITATQFGITAIEGYTPIGFAYFTSGNSAIAVTNMNATTDGTVMTLRNTSSSTTQRTAAVKMIWIRTQAIAVEE